MSKKKLITVPNIGAILTILLYLFYSTNIQAQTLRGTVKSEYGSAIHKISVSIIGADETKTSLTGEFELDISNCVHCSPGNTITIIVFNDEYGFHKIDKTINNNFQVFLEIERKPNRFGITGIIKDSDTQKLLKGISVKLMSTSVADRIPPVTTDEYGKFIIFLRRDILGTIQYLEFIFKDENGKYLDKTETKNISAPLEIFMDKGGSTIEFPVNTYRKSDLMITSGDLVTIKASGNIKVGPWVGHSDPEGRSSGFAGADLSFYNIVQEISHAALLCRFSGDRKWKFAGKELVFYAQQSGFLEFQVNDSDQGNNSGAYRVKLSIQ